MSVAKVTVSIESEVLKQLDGLVSDRVFANRSQAMGAAVKEKIARLNKSRLARACELLDPVEEQAFAEIGASADLEEWPEY
ncbi:MAG: ribbon-helix-helix domain-containing protein [Pyrinomonadaceae bacterium]